MGLGLRAQGLKSKQLNPTVQSRINSWEKHLKKTLTGALNPQPKPQTLESPKP